jgi:multidrug resistance protein MdtO
MATLAQTSPWQAHPLAWFSEFLKQELAPYPSRAAIVARMTIAATLIMIVCMTFRVPYGFQGAIFALLISRENPRSTLQSAATTIFVTGIAGAYLLASVWLVISAPLLHFLWVIGCLFLAFYAIGALTNYSAAVIFAAIISVGVPLWDRHVSAETNVEDTLWLCLVALIAAVITVAVELTFVRFRPGDEVILFIAERLSAIENLLTCYADGRAVDSATERKINRFEILGTSMMRRILRRSNYPRRTPQTWAALLLSLAGSSILQQPSCSSASSLPRTIGSDSGT